MDKVGGYAERRVGRKGSNDWLSQHGLSMSEQGKSNSMISIFVFLGHFSTLSFSISTLWPQKFRNAWNTLVPPNVPNCFLTNDIIRPLKPSQRCQEIPDNIFKHTII